ncbi:MAG: hypothetical protein PHP66_06680 [Syntrophales bacterium]|jgi:hypothetical protein|nr:hypothetical protein [Syntrophales bacterium]
MADYYINIFLDDEKIKKIEGVGLAGGIQEINGRKAVRVGVTAKEQKKLAKSFPDLTPDSSNAYVLPEQAENLVLNMILSVKSFDVMKGAILKLYNPFAGKELLQKTF